MGLRFLGADRTAQAQYLPPPPAAVEVGPNTTAPAPNYVWSPGYWYWYDNRYVWRPGYWVAPQPDWIWMPPQYTYTPGGYLFVPGYWDYTVANRGMVFAPVYMPPMVYAQPAFVFTPSIVISSGVMFNNFFARPSWGFYYFGDYYAPGYAQSGFVFSLSLAFGSNRVAYDPIFSHYAAFNAGWAARARADYAYRVAHVEARPYRTYLEQQAAINRGIVRNEIMGQRLSEVATARASMMNSRAEMVGARASMAEARLERVSNVERAAIAQRAQSLQQVRTQRLQNETAMVQSRANQIARGPRPAAPWRKSELPPAPIRSKRGPRPAPAWRRSAPPPAPRRWLCPARRLPPNRLAIMETRPPWRAVAATPSPLHPRTLSRIISIRPRPPPRPIPSPPRPITRPRRQPRRDRPPVSPARRRRSRARRVPRPRPWRHAPPSRKVISGKTEPIAGAGGVGLIHHRDTEDTEFRRLGLDPAYPAVFSVPLW